MKDKAKVIIVGTLPSTVGIGGVAIHVSRLYEALKKLDIEPILCDYKKLSLFSQIRMLKLAAVVHIHVSNPFGRLLYILICKLMGRRSILTVHGNLGRYGMVKNTMNYFALKVCDVPILINESSYKISLRLNPESQIMSAYIPSAEEEELPESIKIMLLEQKKAGRTIVCTNASGRDFDHKGQEIYGIRFLVEYFMSRKEYFLVISDPSHQYTDCYTGTPSDNIVMIPIKHSFTALLKYADIMIRATSTDGDSISVHEALESGVRVLATDTVERPEGVRLFSYSDALSLDGALADKEPDMPVTRQVSTVDALYMLYKRLNPKQP